MAKILNLDELETTTDKVLVFKAVEHKYVPFTVQQFIDQMKIAEAKDKEATQLVSESVEYMVEMITRAFPTVNADDLKGLTLDRLRLISDFVSGVNEEESAKGAPEDASKN